MDLVVKNGTIVTSTDAFKADIGIVDGKIIEISYGEILCYSAIFTSSETSWA